MSEVPRKPTFPEHMIKKLIAKIQNDVDDEVIPVSTGIYSEEKLIQRLQAIPKPLIEDYGESIFFQITERPPPCSLEKCPNCQIQYSNKNNPIFCHFCTRWNCKECICHRQRLHPRDSNPNGKRYSICNRCDTKFLNLYIGHNYVENRMLLERAITTVSKELDDVEGEVDDIKTERQEKINKPRMENNIKISKYKKFQLDIKKAFKKIEFERQQLNQKHQKLQLKEQFLAEEFEKKKQQQEKIEIERQKELDRLEKLKERKRLLEELAEKQQTMKKQEEQKQRKMEEEAKIHREKQQQAKKIQQELRRQKELQLERQKLENERKLRLQLQRRLKEEEKRRIREEEARRMRQIEEEERRKRQIEEEILRKQIQEEERRIREEEARRIRQIEEEERRKRQIEEEMLRRQIEEKERRKQLEEERRQQQIRKEEQRLQQEMRRRQQQEQRLQRQRIEEQLKANIQEVQNQIRASFFEQPSRLTEDYSNQKQTTFNPSFRYGINQQKITEKYVWEQQQQENQIVEEQPQSFKEKDKFVQYFVEDFTLSTPPKIDDDAEIKLNEPDDDEAIKMAKQEILRAATLEKKVNWKQIDAEGQEYTLIDNKSKCQCSIF